MGPNEADDAVAQARIGSTVAGKWKLDRVLGVGAFAAVYEATHTIGRKAAIKVLHPEAAGSAEWVERFNREALVANELAHPAIVEVHDVDETEDGLHYLVMDLVEGETLTKRLGGSATLSPEELLPLADELLGCLAVAHRANIVHRDIKPSNLMIDQEGRLRVLDFGVARLLRVSRGEQRLTEPGTALGTVAYMAPEQLRGEDVSAQVDLYAVGATLFRALSGRQVHGAGSDELLARQILKTPAPKLRSVAPDVPEGVAKLVDRALSFKAEDRYPDARTMQNAVRSLLDLPEVADEPAAEDAGTHDSARRGPRGTLIVDDADDATTVKRSDDEDAMTVPRKASRPGRVSKPDDASKPGKVSKTLPDAVAPTKGAVAPTKGESPNQPTAARAVQTASSRGTTMWPIALVLAAVLGVVTWQLAFTDGDESERDDSAESDEDDGDDDEDRSKDDDERDRDREGDDDDSSAPSATVSADPSTDVGTGGASPSPEPASPEPGKPTSPAPSASAEPAAPGFPIPSGLPSSIPSTFPSGLPSSFPTAIPSELPTVFPPPPPPPPAQPTPVPPPAPTQ